MRQSSLCDMINECGSSFFSHRDNCANYAVTCIDYRTVSVQFSLQLRTLNTQTTPLSDYCIFPSPASIPVRKLSIIKHEHKIR